MKELKVVKDTVSCPENAINSNTHISNCRVCKDFNKFDFYSTGFNDYEFYVLCNYENIKYGQLKEDFKYIIGKYQGDYNILSISDSSMDDMIMKMQQIFLDFFNLK